MGALIYVNNVSIITGGKNMKSSLKKKIASICLCTIAVTSMFAFNALAAEDNNIEYKFRIQGSVDNAQEADGRFRSTTDNSNAWKVKLEKSGEGNGTITCFWIEKGNGTNASTKRQVQQGKAARYFAANDKGDNTTVYLTAENNNFASTKQYEVSGYWDEETGIHIG